MPRPRCCSKRYPAVTNPVEQPSLSVRDQRHGKLSRLREYATFGHLAVGLALPSPKFQSYRLMFRPGRSS